MTERRTGRTRLWVILLSPCVLLVTLVAIGLKGRQVAPQNATPDPSNSVPVISTNGLSGK